MHTTKIKSKDCDRCKLHCTSKTNYNSAAIENMSTYVFPQLHESSKEKKHEKKFLCYIAKLERERTSLKEENQKNACNLIHRI